MAAEDRAGVDLTANLMGISLTSAETVIDPGLQIRESKTEHQAKEACEVSVLPTVAE